MFFSVLAFSLFAQNFEIEHITSFNTGRFDEAAAEIVAFDPVTQSVFFTNADQNSVTVLDISDLANPTLVADISQDPYGANVNSVDVYGNLIAVAVEAEEVDANGVVTFWNTDGTFIIAVEVGVLPDMLTFTADGSKVLVANEGEPNDDYTIDPEGSVSVIDLSSGVENATSTNIGFQDLGSKEDMIAKGIRIYGPNATAAQDLEPEYLCELPGQNLAVVSCQENNALIVIDLTTNLAVGINPIGFKDHSIEGNGFDASDSDGKIDIKTHPVLGMYQPDAIKYAQIDNQGFIFTANEGDARDYDGYSEEARVEDLNLDPTAYPNAAELQAEENLGRLKTTTAMGDMDLDGDIDQIFSYGARSFSIWNAVDGSLVFDSGDDFERRLADLYPDNFNANNDDNEIDKRSDDKGPEPEAIEIGRIGSRTYCFIGLERIGGIMIYDVTFPSSPIFVTYINNRDFGADVETPEAGDLGVESIVFVPASQSPNGQDILIAANEVSGSISFFNIGRKIETKLFDEELAIENFEAPLFQIPPSPLTTQVVFVGGHDIVQTTPTYGNPAGRAVAKEWHDFIGFTPDESGESIGWIGVNHEMVYRDDRIGDGGGMTAFRITKDDNGEIVIMDQTLEDGRQGQFFNVDFVNTVGETGMNCGGINAPNGRVWTAEEWYRGNTTSIWNSSARTSSLPIRVADKTDGFGVRDTALFTINAPEFPIVDGLQISKYDNFNYMTEVDLKEAKAIRKQYNWGRAGWEGGAVSNDGMYVYLGIDGSPAAWVRFVANTPYDFTTGTLEVYKQDNAPGARWISVPERIENVFGGLTSFAWSVGATMFMRNEWVTIDQQTGIVYWTETGRDGSSGAGSRFVGVNEDYSEALPAAHHHDWAVTQGLESSLVADYQDWYGRVLYYDPVSEEVGVAVNGGPFFENDPTVENYPNKHLSNPDGLSILTIDGQSFLMIQEDLNGSSFGRTPEGISNRMCELYLLDARLAQNADIDDLVRVTAIPAGAEITGGVQIDDNTILINSQHPNPNNPFPYNHSLTIAIHGFDGLTVDGLKTNNEGTSSNMTGQVDVNHITREATFTYESDFAIYDSNGKRKSVHRNTNVVSIDKLEKGEYLILDADEKAYKIEIQ